MKDLPTFKAGDEFNMNENGDLVHIGGADVNENSHIVAYSGITIKKFPNILTDWFEEIPEEYKRWRANRGEKYYAIWCDGTPMAFTAGKDRTFDDTLYSIGGHFKTEEELIKCINYLKALQIIKDDAKGFKPDWKNFDQAKFEAFYNHREKTLDCSEADDCQTAGTICFETKKDIRESFEKHEKEWLIVLGVKE